MDIRKYGRKDKLLDVGMEVHVVQVRRWLGKLLDSEFGLKTIYRVCCKVGGGEHGRRTIHRSLGTRWQVVVSMGGERSIVALV